MKIYTPNKAHEILEKAKKELYLLKTAIKTENEDKLNARIDRIRQLLLEIEESTWWMSTKLHKIYLKIFYLMLK